MTGLFTKFRPYEMRAMIVDIFRGTIEFDQLPRSTDLSEVEKRDENDPG